MEIARRYSSELKKPHIYYGVFVRGWLINPSKSPDGTQSYGENDIKAALFTHELDKRNMFNDS